MVHPTTDNDIFHGFEGVISTYCYIYIYERIQFKMDYIGADIVKNELTIAC